MEKTQLVAEVLLSLGSNVDREQHIARALAELRAVFGELAVSGIYESDSEGFEGDPFFNLAVKFESTLPAEEIATRLREIEIAHGRNDSSRKFEPRALDIDLVFYGDQVKREGGINIPRDEVTQFAFVLEPLAEIAPDFQHPTLGLTLAVLWKAFDKSQLRQRRLNLRF